MPLRVDIEPTALDEILSHPIEVQKVIYDHLNHLRESPGAVSRPSRTPPEPAGYMRYGFDFLHESGLLKFGVYFKYRPDEETIVVCIVHVQRFSL